MTMSARCLVCKNPDRRRAIELMWNGGMSFATISNVLDNEPTSSVINKHIKEHADGNGNTRQVEVAPEKPVRERVLALQRMQLDEIERRIELAKQRADEMNAQRAKVRAIKEAAGEEYLLPDADWSDFTDILGKDLQSAIGSILKTQGLSDKREKAQGDLKLGLFEAMANAGLAPKALVGTLDVKVLTPGDDDDTEA